MNVEVAETSDFSSLIDLAKEVEEFFGPMADEISFHKALKGAIAQHNVFCIRTSEDRDSCSLKGGIIISKEANEIMWFVVAGKYRNQGVGNQLLKFALNKLDSEKDIVVQTFSESIPVGRAARKLYLNSGFVDLKDGGLNPAGIATVIMHIPKTKSIT